LITPTYDRSCSIPSSDGVSFPFASRLRIGSDLSHSASTVVHDIARPPGVLLTRREKAGRAPQSSTRSVYTFVQQPKLSTCQRASIVLGLRLVGSSVQHGSGSLRLLRFRVVPRSSVGGCLIRVGAKMIPGLLPVSTSRVSCVDLGLSFPPAPHTPSRPAPRNPSQGLLPQADLGF